MVLGLFEMYLANCQRNPCDPTIDSDSIFYCTPLPRPCDGPCPVPDVPRPSIIPRELPTQYQRRTEFVQLSPETVPLPPTAFRCGGATHRALMPRPNPQSVFEIGDWQYGSDGYGMSSRWNRRTNVAQLLTRPGRGDPRVRPTDFAAFLSAQGDKVAAILVQPPSERAAGEAPLWAHHVVFDDPTQTGRVLWSQRFNNPTGGAVTEFVATPRLRAWVVSLIAGGSYKLWVSGPNGEHAHELEQLDPEPHQPGYLHADGPNLVWAFRGEIYLWNADRDAIENLTNDTPEQWMPWIEGERVVWVDQRDNPRGNLWHMDNPEIYFYDLRTHERRRITNDPPERPAQQRVPSLHGDWIIWQDYRDAVQRPNPPDVQSDRTAIWGYHMPTRREMPIHRGDFLAENPRIIGTEIYFGCSNYAERGAGGFSVPLPTLGDVGM